jgi:hypothetical protein
MFAPFAFTKSAKAAGDLWNSRFDLNYGYTKNLSKLADLASADMHTITPEFFMQDKKGVALDISALYQNSAKDDITGKKVAGNTYGATISPAADLIALAHDAPSGTTKLTLALNSGYRRTDQTTTTAATAVDSNSDALALGPALTFEKDFSESCKIQITPTYVQNWKSTVKAGTAGTARSESGLLTIPTRFIFSLNDKVTVTPFGTWKHDVFQNLPPGVPSHNRDWAEFGLQLSYVLSEKASVRVGYSYEAFHPEFETHNVSVRLDFPL